MSLYGSIIIAEVCRAVDTERNKIRGTAEVWRKQKMSLVERYTGTEQIFKFSGSVAERPSSVDTERNKISALAEAEN